MALSILKKNPHLLRCFGQGKKRCICPPRLKPVCDATRLTPHRSPLVLKSGPGERPLGYAVIDKRVLRWWGYDEHEPSDGAKLTYLHLLGRAEKRSRWVFARPGTLAKQRGVPERTLVEHLKQLELLGLILRVPMCDVIPARQSKRYKTIFLLDLPPGLGGVSSDAAAEDAATGPNAQDERDIKSRFRTEHRDDSGDASAASDEAADAAVEQEVGDEE